jgi:cytochrome b
MRREVQVWDLPIRLLHWSLVVTVAAAWLTEDGPSWLHDWAGYAALAVIAARGFWGIVGSPPARFASFVRPWSTTRAYATALFQATEPRHVGHNPLGGWMIVVLLLTVAATGLSGWLYTTDAFWGVAWVETVHEIFANFLLGLIILHIAGVIFTSFRQRENLVSAMIDGRKESRRGDQEPD